MAAIIKEKKAAEKRAEWEAAAKLWTEELERRRKARTPSKDAAGPAVARPQAFGRGAVNRWMEAAVGRPTSRDVRAQEDASMEIVRTIEYGDASSEEDFSQFRDDTTEDDASDSELGAAGGEPKGQ